MYPSNNELSPHDSCYAGIFLYNRGMDRREYYRLRNKRRRANPEYREMEREKSREYYKKNRAKLLACSNDRYRKLTTYCTRCSRNYPLPDLKLCEECL